MRCGHCRRAKGCTETTWRWAIAARITTWVSGSPLSSHSITSAISPGTSCCVRSFVNESPVASGHANRAAAPAAWLLGSLKGAGVEVKVEDDPVEPAKSRVQGHHANVVHRPRVTGNGHPILVLGINRLLAPDESNGLPRRHAEPLDRGRPFDAAGANLPAQGADPWHLPTDLLTKFAAELIQLLQAAAEIR